jgi:hypothetical protein
MLEPHAVLAGPSGGTQESAHFCGQFVHPPMMRGFGGDTATDDDNTADEARSEEQRSMGYGPEVKILRIAARPTQRREDSCR